MAVQIRMEIMQDLYSIYNYFLLLFKLYFICNLYIYIQQIGVRIWYTEIFIHFDWFTEQKNVFYS
jgi:predicted membrane-bound dolichyl-phosphate-mannose-protein mannosyltransferase